MYWFYKLSLLVLSSELCDSSKFIPKIVGGVPVDIYEHPYVVVFINAGSMCAGIIINKRLVLTAAHCFDNKKDVTEMQIYAGSRYMMSMESSVHDVVAFIVHKNYNQTIIFSHDIAMMLVDGPFKYGRSIRQARLVTSDMWMTSKNKNFILTGWGQTSEDGQLSNFGLLKTQLRYISLPECMRWHDVQLSNDMFCLYGDGKRDSCKGDSGGGVSWKNMIVGIVSHGDGCAQVGKPSVYCNIWFFRTWIMQTRSQFKIKLCKLIKDKHL